MNGCAVIVLQIQESTVAISVGRNKKITAAIDTGGAPLDTWRMPQSCVAQKRWLHRR